MFVFVFFTIRSKISLFKLAPSISLHSNFMFVRLLCCVFSFKRRRLRFSFLFYSKHFLFACLSEYFLSVLFLYFLKKVWSLDWRTTKWSNINQHIILDSKEVNGSLERKNIKWQNLMDLQNIAIIISPLKWFQSPNTGGHYSFRLFWKQQITDSIRLNFSIIYRWWISFFSPHKIPLSRKMIEFICCNIVE